MMELEPGGSVYKSLDQIYKSAERAAQILGNPPTQNPEFPNRPDESRCFLLAESDNGIRESAQSLLEHAGHKVVLARNSQETLEALQAHASRISVFLLDLALPGMDGVQLLRFANALQPGLQTFVWSPFVPADLDQIVEGLSNVEYVPKPAQSADIPRILSRMIEPALKY